MQAASVLIAFLSLAGAASAQTPAPAAPPPAAVPFQIADNSFLVEEAYNQGRGIFQNISRRSRGRAATGC